MDEIMNNILNNVREYTKDIDQILNDLKKINGNTIFVGSGGSKVVSVYAARVLLNKNGIATNVIDISSIDEFLSSYENLFISSYSGSNYGVKYSLEKNKKRYLFSSRKTNVFDEKLIHYDINDEHSFISIGATIIPMAILLKYYLGDDFDRVLDEIFNSYDKLISLNHNGVINIFKSNSSLTAATFLDSTLTESGIAIPIIHDKYDYCHGRSTINKSHNNSAIIFSDNLDIDNELIKVIDKTMKDYVVITSPFDDNVVSDFYYTLTSLYLTYNLAKMDDIDLSDIDYDRVAVKSLYHFKGSM